MFPFRNLMLDQWASIDRISLVQVRTIVFHGTDDGMIPIGKGRSLAAAAADGQFIEVPGGTHNDIPVVQLRQELMRVVE